jgi:hypothetical protein
MNSTDQTIQAGIDNLVAAGGGFDNVNVATPGPNLKYNSATGEVEQSGPSVDSPIPDHGDVPEVLIAKIQENVNALTAKFNAETNYDKRAVLGAQLARAQEAADYDMQRLAKLTVQREAQARAESAAANQKLAQAAFANGDQARSAALQKALLEEEARLAAQTIINTRVEAIRQGRR